MVCLADIMKAASHMVWMAQTNHNAHHVPEGSWRDCGIGVCASMEHMLAQIGLDKELKPVERAVF